MVDKVRELVAWQLVLLNEQHPDDFGLSLDNIPITPLFVSNDLDLQWEEGSQPTGSSLWISRSLPDLSDEIALHKSPSLRVFSDGDVRLELEVIERNANLHFVGLQMNINNFPVQLRSQIALLGIYCSGAYWLCMFHPIVMLQAESIVC